MTFPFPVIPWFENVKWKKTCLMESNDNSVAKDFIELNKEYKNLPSF